MTIRDVARAAEVSVTSVSNYLNGRHGEMRPETMARIAATIESLGYTPNGAARQLKTGHAPILGLLLPSVANPYFGELAVAVDAAAQKRGFQVILCNTQRQAERENAFIQELMAYGVRGILATSLPRGGRNLGALVRRGAAFVIFETLAADPGVERVDVVSMDNVLAAGKAVDHLVSLGHERIAYATATPLTPHRLLRLRGFQAALRRHRLEDGIVVKDEDVIMDDATQDDTYLARFGHMAALRILAMSPRPTAVVALNDQIALGMMFSFLGQKLKVPDDVSIVGIDDILLSGIAYPALTTVRQPYR
jgi:DNA-binding LacI/PurR family transcriptional regulator